jgi:hypothetical protein
MATKVVLELTTVRLPVMHEEPLHGDVETVGAVLKSWLLEHRRGRTGGGGAHMWAYFYPMPGGGSDRCGEIDLLPRGDGGCLARVKANPDDWPALKETWAALRAELETLDFVEDREDGERGMKAGTENRVRTAHDLLKRGLHSQRYAFKKAHTDARTYQRWCKTVTGEDPIEPE